MPNKNFLLLSMEDDKIKKISNVISNESCRKILDYLSNKEATESELAEKLGIPISTVHYNLQQLMETGLIDSKEFHYSTKGKEVNHYKLANKYIIIAPKKTFGIKKKLKTILPVALIAAGTAGVIRLYGAFQSRGLMAKSAIAERAMNGAAMESAAMEAAKPAVAFMETTNLAPDFSGIALWFFAGALFALVTYLTISLLRKDAR